MSTVPRALRDNGLSIALGALFIVCIVAQSATGLALYNGDQETHGQPTISWAGYIASGHFLSGVFVNWQAALLQLATLILFGVFLRQHGAPHSRQTPTSGGRPAPSGSHAWKDSWLYRNSLSLVFFAAFAVAFVLHLLAGMADYNHERMLSNEAPLTLAAYASSAKFWFLTFQTWEAEYFAIALYIVLSIVLRQAGSPESKPADASNDDTGEGDTK